MECSYHYNHYKNGKFQFIGSIDRRRQRRTGRCGWEGDVRMAYINPEDFEQMDMGLYQCETEAVLWEGKTKLLATCWEEFAGYGYNRQAVVQCTDRINICLRWIAAHREHIQKIISEDSTSQQECSFGMTVGGLRKIEIEVDVHDKVPQETVACMYIDASPFFAGHCHCIEVAVLERADNAYEVYVIEDQQRLLLEMREALQEQNAQACEWAEANGIFYAFDTTGNMLAVAGRQFCVSADHKLVEENDGNGDKTKRSALYLICSICTADQYYVCGLPLPYGFVTRGLTCDKDVFTITSGSGHQAITGAFYVIQEALTMIEMLYSSRGVTEEEINRCYYEFLPEDHQKYMERIGKL